MPAADLAVLHDRTWRRIDIAVGRIERLGLKLAAENAAYESRLREAAELAREALAAALDSLDAFDHRQPHTVHDGILATIARLRALQSVLAGTPPKGEAPTQRHIRRNGLQ